MIGQAYSGVWVPALTPFHPELTVDRDAFAAHCRWLLDQGADGLAVFGTTSEANSLSVNERISLLDELVEAGIPAARLMPGTGCCALPDTIRLSVHAAERGCRAVLMLPPFYYKGVSDDGLFSAFSRVLDETPPDLALFLYHIPPMTGVPIPLPLIDRLREAWPARIAGVKDSGGQWPHTRSLIERFPELRIFAGSERFLLDTLRAGGAGCITASGNINPGGIRAVYEAWQRGDPGADAAQRRITAVRDVVERYPMIPALKSLCTALHGSPEWATVRPPLVALGREEGTALADALVALGFSVHDGRGFTLASGT